MADRSGLMKGLMTFIIGGVIGMIVGALWMGPEQVGGLSEHDVAAIREFGGPQMTEIVLAEDWEGFAGAFTEDAVRMPPNEPLQQGRAAIETWATTNWAPLTTIEYKQVALDIDGAGDIAYAQGSYSLTFEAPDVAGQVTDIGKFLVILRRQPDGSWLVSKSIYNSDAPLATGSAELGT